MITSSSGVGTTGTSESTATDGRATLGKDDFLALLVAQLRYQDPLSPLENAQFIEQMTSFSAVEQLTNLREATERLAFGQSVGQATAMIGRSVTHETESGTATGTVQRIEVDAGVVRLRLDDGTAVDLTSVREVG